MLRLNDNAFKEKRKLAVQKVAKKAKIILVVGAATLMLAGCEPTEISTNSHVSYDVIDTMDNSIVENGIKQVKDVPGENFKLAINYRCLLDDNAKWTITSDKDLYYDVRTEGLPDGWTVYIDNVHIDTTIISHYPSVDGITQDTMDDRIHNAQMKGFPISDTNNYGNICSIEGQNQQFIQGSFWGFNGYQSGEIEQKRYVESDYLNAAVTGNKISVVYDLIIEKADGTVRCVSVGSVIGVSVWPYIELNDGTFRYYHWNNSTNSVDYRNVSPEEYQQMIHQTGMGLGKN